MENLWRQFVQERVYLNNVSPRTAEWYGWVEKAFSPYAGKFCASGGTSKEVLKEAIIRMREKGLDPVTIAGYIRGLNAFLRWGHTEGHFEELLVISVPRCEQKLVLSLTPEQVQRFLKWKPVHSSQRRTFVLVCLLLDTGMRISEAIDLRKADLNLDDLLIKMKGKGGKHRL